MNDVKNLLDAIPWPALLVNKEMIVETYNSSAKNLFEHLSINTPLVNIVRQPNVLNAVEKSFSEVKSNTARFLDRKIHGNTLFNVSIKPVENTKDFLICFEDINSAELTNKQRRDFVANVSHELRSPLTAIIGFLEALNGPAKLDVTAQSKFIQLMSTETHRMNSLINDLLSLNKVEDMQRQRPKLVVDLVSAVRKAIDHTDLAVKKANVNLIININEPLGEIMGDFAQLVQVFVNIIENGLKYGCSNPNPAIIIFIEPIVFDTILGCDAIKVTISDNGIGIEPHLIPRLTERFFRVDNHRSREAGGTGLGLAIVKHIIQRHRGRMAITSSLGEGSNIQLFFPK